MNEVNMMYIIKYYVYTECADCNLAVKIDWIMIKFTQNNGMAMNNIFYPGKITKTCGRGMVDIDEIRQKKLDIQKTERFWLAKAHFLPYNGFSRGVNKRPIDTREVEDYDQIATDCQSGSPNGVAGGAG